MATVTNPTTFSITDPTFVADGVTSMTIEVGTAVGGPFTTKTVTVPAADVTGETGGVVTGTIASLSLGLANGTYWAVCTATNGSGTSSASPVSNEFILQGTPSAPTVLAFS